MELLTLWKSFQIPYLILWTKTRYLLSTESMIWRCLFPWCGWREWAWSRWLWRCSLTRWPATCAHCRPGWWGCWVYWALEGLGLKYIQVCKYSFEDWNITSFLFRSIHEMFKSSSLPPSAPSSRSSRGSWCTATLPPGPWSTSSYCVCEHCELKLVWLYIVNKYLNMTIEILFIFSRDFPTHWVTIYLTLWRSWRIFFYDPVRFYLKTFEFLVNIIVCTSMFVYEAYFVTVTSARTARPWSSYKMLLCLKAG